MSRIVGKFVVAAFITIAVPMFFSHSAAADGIGGPYIDQTMVDQLRVYDSKAQLVSCFAQGAPKGVTSSYIEGYSTLMTSASTETADWFRPDTFGKEHGVRVSYFTDATDGLWICQGDVNNNLTAVLSSLGWKTRNEAFCAIGGTKSLDNQNTVPCNTNTLASSFVAKFPKPDKAQDINNAITKQLGGTEPIVTPQLRYLAAWQAMYVKCKLTVSDSTKSILMKDRDGTTAADGTSVAIANTVVVNVVNMDATKNWVRFVIGEDQSDFQSVARGDLLTRTGENGGSGDGIHYSSCQAAADDMNNENNLSKYVAAIGNIETKKPQAPPGGGVDPVDGTKSSCTVEGIGWIVCPVMSFMTDVNTGLYNFIKGFLAVPTSLFQDKVINGNNVAVKSVWNTFRGFANILFIVAFLIIIYSQITSVGISNYGIKKLLPKLIVAAILVNTSYYICLVAIDISNIMGYGLQSLFSSFGGGMEVSSGISGAKGDEGWGFMTTLMATGAAIVAVLVAGGGMVLLAGLLALAMAALILIARQAIIVLLVVVSPVAFVFWLLPNTEKWFKKWRELFFAMLVLFPVISVLFGAGALASQILGSVSTSTDPTTAEHYFPKIAALAASVLPLFAIVPLLQGALKSTGALGAKLSGMSQKANSKVGSAAKDTAKKRYDNSTLGRFNKYRKGEKERNRALMQAGAYRGKNPYYKLRSAVSGGINGVIPGQFGKRTAAAGIAASQKIDAESIDNEALRMQNGWQSHEVIPKAQAEYKAALESGDKIKARAAQKILLGKGGAGVGAIRKVIASDDGSFDGAAVNSVKHDLASAGLKSKDAGLDKWSYSSGSLSSIDSTKSTYDGLTDSELSTQTTLERARKSGALADGRAQRIIDNKDLHGNLTGEKFIDLNLAAGANAQPTSGPQAGPDGSSQDTLF